MKDKNTSFQNGSVRKKGNKWYYRFRMQEEDGRWKMHEFQGGETKRETQALLRQALGDYNMSGRVISPGNLTVTELGDMWYADEVEHSALTTIGTHCSIFSTQAVFGTHEFCLSHSGHSLNPSSCDWFP